MMGRSINAAMHRMMKDKIFWFSVVFQIGFALVVIIPTYGIGFSIGEGMLFADSLISLFLSTIFVPFFLHCDYRDGIMRNKIMTGHTRAEIYSSNYISALTGSSIFLLTPIIIALILSPFFGGSLGAPPAEFAFRIMLSLAANAAMCSIYVLTAFLCRNTGAAVSLIISFGMFIASIFCTLNSESPEETAQIFESAGMSFTLDPDGMLNRALCSFLPTSHIVKASFNPPLREIALLPLYSLAVIAVAIGIGVLLFRKKELK